MMKIGRGFTLVEILIVVVIVAVLAAMVLPRFLSQSERGVVAEGVSMLSALRQAEVAYHLENTAYTDNLDDLDVDVSSSTKFSYEANPGNGTVTAKREGGDYNNKTITLDIDGTWGGTHDYKPSN